MKYLLSTALVLLFATLGLGAQTKVCGPPYVDLIVMVDNSKSMSTSLYAKQASFVDKLQDALFKTGQQNRMWLYKFDNVPTLLKAKASSKFSWSKSYNPDSATDHKDAMIEAKSVYDARSDKKRQPVFLLVTDGQPHKVACSEVTSCSYSACQFSGCSSKCGGTTIRRSSKNYCEKTPNGKVGKYCARHCHEACLCSVRQSIILRNAGVRVVTVQIQEGLDAGEAESSDYMMRTGYASSSADHHPIANFNALTSSTVVDDIMDSICSGVAATPTEAPTKFPTANPTKFPTSAPTSAPTTSAPTTIAPTSAPTTNAPTTSTPTTSAPTSAPTTGAPTKEPTDGPTEAPTGAPTSMQIHVVDLEGVKYTYDVTPTTKIADLVKEIAKDTGYPVDAINIKQRKNDKQVKSTKFKPNLKKHGIVHDDILDMFYFIHVVDPDGNKATIDCTPSTTKDEIEAEIEKELPGAPADPELIDEDGNAIVPGGLRDPNGIGHDDTIYIRPPCPSNEALTKCPKLKAKACGSKKNRNLCTKCGKKCLPGTNALVCDIKTLYSKCAVDKMQIHVVDLEGNKFTYEVDLTESIDEIKQKVSDDTGIPKEFINLKDAAEKTLGKGTTSLTANKVQDEDTLFMYYFIHVVDPEGNKHTFTVLPDEDIDALKASISAKTGIDVADIDLVDNANKPIDAGKLNDNANGVEHDDTLFMPPTCPSYEALTKCPKLKAKACGSKKNRKLCTKCGFKCFPGTNAHVCEMKVNKRGMFYDHCVTTDAPTAAPTPMLIHVVDLDGNKFTYEVTGADVIKAIEEKAAADAGMDVDDVNLKEADDTILDKPFSSLDFNKIVHDDTLYMYYHIHVVTEDGTKHTFDVNPDDSVESIKDKIKDKTGVDVDVFIDSGSSEVDTGDLNSVGNNVNHDDTLYVRPSCPSDNALKFCPSYGYSSCIGKLKGRKHGCTWCKSSKSCLPTTSNHFCEVGQGAFGHCVATEAPTEPANYCPAGFVFTGSRWACDDRNLEKLGYGPATWKTTNRCRGFDDVKRNYKNAKGEYICVETDAGALGYKYGDACSKMVTYEDAKAHCERMNARLCTAEELQNSCAERTGCDYDYVHIWSGTPCNPSSSFGPKHTKGHFVMPGDMRKWKNRNTPDGKNAPGFTYGGAFLKNSKDYVIWPDSGLMDEGFILNDPKRYHYLDAIKTLFGDDLAKCNPEDDEFGRCCIPDSYAKTKFFTRCCADYGETPSCEKCPSGKTSLPGYDKTLDDCFCIEGSLDAQGGCTGPDGEKPDGIVTAKPTTTPAPTPQSTLATCPSKEDYYRCPNLGKLACEKESKQTDAQRSLAPEERTGGCKRCAQQKSCIAIPGEHVGRAWICESVDFSHCPAEYANE